MRELSPADLATLADCVRSTGHRMALCPECTEREQGPDGLCRPCHVKRVAERYQQSFAAIGWRSAWLSYVS